MESFKVTTEVKRSVNAITEIGMGGCAIPAAPRSGKNSKPKRKIVTPRVLNLVRY